MSATEEGAAMTEREPVPESEFGPKGLLRPGHCCHCDRYRDAVMAVAIEGGNSGPGYLVEACVPHARALAARVLAPQWLRDDLAELDRAMRENTGRGTELRIAE
ncbi:hypothetical protein [Streptomyces axinellae]